MKAHWKNGKEAGKHGNIPVLSRSNPAISRVLLKRFIAEFNFSDPSWDDLPPNFPFDEVTSFAHLPYTPDGLTKQEKHLLGAIKLAYFTLEGGRETLIKKTLRTGALTLGIAAISLITLISLISLGGEGSLTKPVNAATVSAQIRKTTTDIVESTQSAILRK